MNAEDGPVMEHLIIWANLPDVGEINVAHVVVVDVIAIIWAAEIVTCAV